MADEEEIPGADVLSQSEVEDILASIGAETEDQVKVISRRLKQPEKHQLEEFDFRSPVFLSAAEMRRLRIKNEEFIRSLSAALSVYLQMEFGLQMSRLETLTYQMMLESLPMPSHLTLFRMNPLNGICLMDISPRLGLTILDRMMGGPGHSIKNERDFTDIEVTVLQDFIHLILKEFANSWQRYQNLEHEIIEHENTARFLNIVEPDEVILYLEMEARLGDCLAGIRFMIPYRMMEGIIDQLMAEISNQEGRIEEKKAPTVMVENYKNIPIILKTFLKGLSMTLGEIKDLDRGDLILLDEKLCNQVIVELGKIPKFKGQVDILKEPVSVTLTEKMDTNYE
ncbi:MAG: flagellar motor switch protein FliM [Verrucomicrobiota bacterium]